jgi:hypothetical protein
MGEDGEQRCKVVNGEIVCDLECKTSWDHCPAPYTPQWNQLEEHLVRNGSPWKGIGSLAPLRNAFVNIDNSTIENELLSINYNL